MMIEAHLMLVQGVEVDMDWVGQCAEPISQPINTLGDHLDIAPASCCGQSKSFID